MQEDFKDKFVSFDGTNQNFTENNETITTIILDDYAKWGRSAILKIENDQIIFDCSDEEYGPIYIKLELVEQAIKKHKKVLNEG